MSTFKVDHLLVKELDYELKIRSIDVTEYPTVEAKRKILRGALRQEKENRSFRQISSSCIPFDKHKEEIEDTLKDLTQKIGIFRGTILDPTFARLSSRVAHLSERVSRLECDTDEQELYHKTVAVKILDIEGDLDARGNPAATSTPNAPVHNASPFPFSKSAQVHKWGISFSGTGDCDTVVAFLEKVECLRISRCIPEDDLFAASAELFTGPAFTWFMNNRSNLSCWKDLVQKLKADFLPYSYQDDLLDDIKKRKQLQNEPVTMFINNILGLCSRLDIPLTESEKVRIIMKSLLPSYHSQLALVEIRSIDELTEKCKRLEETFSWSNQPSTVVSSRPFLSSSQNSFSRNRSWQNKVPKHNVSTVTSTIVCWNCYTQGHAFSACPNPRLRPFCFGCGLENTTKPRCRNCQGNGRLEDCTLSPPLTVSPSGNSVTSINNTGLNTSSPPVPSTSRKGKGISSKKTTTSNNNLSQD
ncbi:uncharacterized protein LOC126879691 [Diabrotica virgifera virgifera]|uniref:Retrotransposon gag domain-containing protein n=1 Tax=Diabrotica virgifera virgifera TaxID=50390 RepID=A0ABM5JLL9_DIAVI|nr:uncharacterized protein LOC126879691 [Diabrotica virgifera virgifera]